MTKSNFPVVAFQGVKGAYSEAAIKKLLGNNLLSQPNTSFAACFKSLASNECDYALLPIENSAGGSIHQVFDLLLRHKFFIIAELDFPVHHCLLAPKGSKLADITTARSHPQALAQCQDYLRSKNITQIPDFDTAGSAEKVANENLKVEAAIASELAASVYDLDILDSHIEDSKTNTTRFLLLSRTNIKIPPELQTSNTTKTSLVFSHKNVPGALHSALGCFANRGLDLTKLESRPNRDFAAADQIKYPFVFYADILAHPSNPLMQAALSELADLTVFLRILGSFPTDGRLVDELPGQFGKTPTDLDESLMNNAEVSKGSVEKDALVIGILGFGNFGQFLAKTFVKHSKVVGYSRTDYSKEANELGVEFFKSFEEFMKQKMDVLVLSVAILALDAILPLLEQHCILLDKVLVVDVLSVKSFPKQKLNSLKEKALKQRVTLDLLFTHPMFGPESGKHSWSGLPFAYEPPETKTNNCNSFLQIFQSEGCRMITLSCESHDKQAASSQFITHFVGRAVSRLNLEESEISTTGFKSLLNIRDQTVKDSWDLFSALYKYNTQSADMISRLKIAIHQLEQDLLTTNQSSKTKSARILDNVHESRTAQLFGLAGELKAEGRDIVSTLAIGEPDFLPPKCVIEAMHKAVDAGKLKYVSSPGLPALRQAIADKYNARNELSHFIPLKKENVLISTSGKQVLYQILKGTMNPGEAVIIPAPYWTSYPDIVTICGGTPIIVETKADNDFILQSSELEECLNNASKNGHNVKYIIFCNPSNPTGAVHTPEQIEDLVKTLSRPEFAHIEVLSDEIYSNLVYEHIHNETNGYSMLDVPGMEHRVIRMSGFSKNYAMTGLRVGFMIADAEIVSICQKVQSQINTCAASVSQYAALAAIEEVVYERDLVPLYEELVEKKNLIVSLLREIDHLIVPEVTGAFYAFVDIGYFLMNSKIESVKTSTQLSMYLLEKHGVALVCGDAFGYPNGMRLSFATAKADIKEAIRRFKIGLLALIN